MLNVMNGSPGNWRATLRSAAEAIKMASAVLMKGLNRDGAVMSIGEVKRAWNRAHRSMQELRAYERRRFDWKYPRRSGIYTTRALVLLRDPLHPRRTMGKLSPTWMGPFEIITWNFDSSWPIGRQGTKQPRSPAHSSQTKSFLTTSKRMTNVVRKYESHCAGVRGWACVTELIKLIS